MKLKIYYNDGVWFAHCNDNALYVLNPELIAEGIKNYSETINGVRIYGFAYTEGTEYEWPGSFIKRKSRISDREYYFLYL